MKINNIEFNEREFFLELFDIPNNSSNKEEILLNNFKKVLKKHFNYNLKLKKIKKFGSKQKKIMQICEERGYLTFKDFQNLYGRTAHFELDKFLAMEWLEIVPSPVGIGQQKYKIKK